MRAADGTAYPMHKRFIEVVVPERMIVEHMQAGHEFQLHMSFTALHTDHTRLEAVLGPHEALGMGPAPLHAATLTVSRLGRDCAAQAVKHIERIVRGS